MSGYKDMVPCPRCGGTMRSTNVSGRCNRCRKKENNAEYSRRRYARERQTRATYAPPGYPVKYGGGFLTELFVSGDPRINRKMDSWFALAVTLAHDARLKAMQQGHDMEELQPDETPGGWVAQCWACDGFVVVDIIESKTAYGRATEGPCTGAPPVPPAKRRNLMDEAASTTHLVNEAVGTEDEDIITFKEAGQLASYIPAEGEFQAMARKP